MPDIAALIQHGSTNLWLFIPSAILLGALHGLEPGHSKTMMAAFIVAIRGSVTQAVLLGLSATISHTAVVWLIALIGLHYGSHWNMETTEPYFQVASAFLIIAIAFWMMWRTWKHKHDHDKGHSHAHGHDHSHGDESHVIDTGHGIVKLDVFEDNAPPRFRLYDVSKDALSHYTAQEVSIETKRPDGSLQQFAFATKTGFMESVDEIPEPHEFSATLKISHGNHNHDYTVAYAEHVHTHDGEAFNELASTGYQDPHELAHANEIRSRFANQNITTGQIILFGLTGGLIPCPASITILLLCLQLKKVALGALLVLCFSIGLALTMVTSGIVAALSVKHISKRWSGFNALAAKAPYFSGTVITLIGLYIGYSGLKVLI